MWLRSSAISLDGYCSKTRKVSRCRPTVSNGTVIATKQEFFFTKVAPLQSITDIVLLGFLLILLPFISSNITINFFVMNLIFFFECLCFSEYETRMLLFVFWLTNRSSIKYVCNWGHGGGHPKCVQVRTGGGGVSSLMCTCALTCTYSFHFLMMSWSKHCLMVSCFICRNLS